MHHASPHAGLHTRGWVNPLFGQRPSVAIVNLTRCQSASGACSEWIDYNNSVAVGTAALTVAAATYMKRKRKTTRTIKEKTTTRCNNNRGNQNANSHLGKLLLHVGIELVLRGVV